MYSRSGFNGSLTDTILMGGLATAILLLHKLRSWSFPVLQPPLLLLLLLAVLAVVAEEGIALLFIGSSPLTAVLSLVGSSQVDAPVRELNQYSRPSYFELLHFVQALLLQLLLLLVSFSAPSVAILSPIERLSDIETKNR